MQFHRYDQQPEFQIEAKLLGFCSVSVALLSDVARVIFAGAALPLWLCDGHKSG